MNILTSTSSLKINVLIVEDDAVSAEILKKIIHELNLGFVVQKTIYNLVDVEEYVKSSDVDLIFMDINLEGAHEGILSAQNLLKYKKDIIFVSSYTDIETINLALDNKPITYIVKPFEKFDIHIALKMYLGRSENFLYIKDGLIKYKLIKDEIIYLKSDKNYIDIFTTDKRYSVRSSYEKIMNELNDPRFVKVNRSFVVNELHIKKISQRRVYISDQVISISGNVFMDL